MMPPLPDVPALRDNPALAGLFAMLHPENENEHPSTTEILDDFEGEQETLLPGTADVETGDDDPEADDDDDDEKADTNKEENIRLLQIGDTIRNASKGVTEGTDAEYKKYVLLHAW